MNIAEGIQSLADVLPAHAARHPDKVAVQEWDGRGLRDTTYGELARRAAAFSVLLRERGVGEGDKVAVLMPNGLPWVVAYFGVLGCGAVAVPLDYELLDHDPAHVSYVLGHAEARLLVVARKDAEEAEPLAAEAGAELLPHDGAAAPGCDPDTWQRPAINPSETAQLLYTSGTTGRRKGVVLTHSNVLSNVRACCKSFKMLPQDCLPAVLPFHHAYSLTTTLVLPLYVGGRVPVGDVRSRQTPDLLRASRPTVLIGVPRMFESMLSGIESAARREGKLQSLRRARALSGAVKKWTALNVGKVLFRSLHRRLFGGTQLRLCMSGGARLPRRLILEYLKLGIPILQGWGMTELSPVGTVQPYRPLKLYFTRYYERKAGSIGIPLDGTEINLIDVPEQDIYVDRDGEGEMVVRGPHLMREYYRDPEATQKIVLEAGLRTGDIARRDPDGNLYVVGRAKHVIVLPGGKKVFPEEDLYDPLAGCPSIEEFTVRAIRAPGGAEKIGIIIKPNADALRAHAVTTLGELYRLLKREITQALRGKPDYMKQFDFCLTELRDGAFCDLVKTSLNDPCPLKNEFRFDRAHSVNRDSGQELDLRAV